MVTRSVETQKERADALEVELAQLKLENERIQKELDESQMRLSLMQGKEVKKEYPKATSKSLRLLNEISGTSSSLGADITFILSDAQHRLSDWDKNSVANILLNKHYDNNEGHYEVYDKDKRIEYCQEIILKKLGLQDEGRSQQYGQLIKTVNRWIEEADKMVAPFFNKDRNNQAAVEMINGLMVSRLQIGKGKFTINEAVQNDVDQSFILNALNHKQSIQQGSPQDSYLFHAMEQKGKRTSFSAAQEFK